ncbi:FAD-dependent oxidoreductase [Sulfolobales archaeon HS-7]|nr:FAD-dependent oxidoreductase [Sulfolobales archaeon HS-7]
MRTVEFDAVVVGTGPAGSASALVAAKKGLKVLVIERGPEPGSKTVSGAMIRIDEVGKVFGTDIPIERQVKRFKVIIANGGDRVNLDFPVSGLGTVGRRKFDAWMSSKAEAAGAVVITKTSVTGIKRTEGGIKVLTDRGEISTGRVVLAEGANPILSMSLRIRDDLTPEDAVQTAKEVYSMPQTEVTKRMGLSADTDGEVWRVIYVNKTFGAGFLYTYKDAIAIGAGAPMKSMIEKKYQPNVMIEDFKEDLGLKQLLSGTSLREYSAKIIPESGFPYCKAGIDNVYLAGDAIGLVNPLTFDGIGPAIASGVIAGNAVAEGWDPRKYEEALKYDPLIKSVISSRKLVKQLLSTGEKYVTLLPEIMKRWASGDLYGIRELVSENAWTILKDLTLLMQVRK